ncbi:MAG: hypothetical protein F6K50_10225 [Moorea sp. SIO3I7]|uniref:hypothetical protein n=1 Tax=unclassified Moorena TaxID=2683338 RepID=UPI0013BF5502|nr:MULTISPECIES: hypothetical protein [unclassified Moorena]NEN95890.1 hypothetical protein [Moorena sp. SIO3I7]NEO05122.1 hypothetical protein [Moorena sp. SIO3I8]NEO18939.1 hypothetical protein [Moorena sp. SIO4A5]NEP21065.1 hypothetical protein [Moorena sp. SIO3I6]NEQ56142.1 hypothetical protein [Moorena sp. SIO4A1]
MQAINTKDRLKHRNHDLVRDLIIKVISRVIAFYSNRDIHLNFLPYSLLPTPYSLLPTQLDT